MIYVVLTAVAVAHLFIAGLMAGLVAGFAMAGLGLDRFSPAAVAIVAWLAGLIWPLVLLAVFIGMVRSELNGGPAA